MKGLIMLEFDLLTPSQIEVRVATVNASGCSLLVYKDARTDMNMLDNHPQIGPSRWQCRYYELKGNIYCSLGIWINDFNSPGLDHQEWIWKDDCGAESYTEKEKGEASDAFKRAGFRWGIGRELYTVPKNMFAYAKKQNGDVLINIKESEFNGKKKYTTYDKFSVEKIKYNENRQVTDIAIRNETTSKRVFVYNTTGKDDK